MAEGEPRYHNQGAVAVLSAPTWHEPEMKTFDAVQPRPLVSALGSSRASGRSQAHRRVQAQHVHALLTHAHAMMWW